MRTQHFTSFQKCSTIASQTFRQSESREFCCKLVCGRIIYIGVYRLKMTRNLLSKFKKPLQQSSRIVYQSRISPDQQDSLIGSGHMSQTKKDTDRTSLYKSINYNHETNKILQKIPILIKENQQLRSQVERLQQDIALIKSQAYRRQSQSIRDDPVFRKKIQLEISMLKIVKQCRPVLKHKQRLYSSTGRFSTQAIDSGDELSSRPHKNRQRNALKHSNSRLFELQKDRDQLKKQNQLLKLKLKQFTDQQHAFSAQIDEINEIFKKTLKEKQSLLLSQQSLYLQQIGVIQLKLTNITSENKVLRVRNSNLSEKLQVYELEMSKLKEQPQHRQNNQVYYNFRLVDCPKQPYFPPPQGSDRQL